MKNGVKHDVTFHNAERVEDTARPFRLWDTRELKNVPRRYYGDERRAINGALAISTWDLKVGRSIEVYDARTMRLCGVIVRRIDGLKFLSLKTDA